MGKFKSLISNTLIFAVATFSTKLLGFVIRPILTRILLPEEYSGVENAIVFCNFILPIMYLCISEAVIRFGLEPGRRKRDVYTTGILTVLGGYVVFLLAAPLLERWNFIAGYGTLVRAFVLASAMRTVTTHFVRSGNLVRIFAMDGLMTSLTTLVLVYVFLVPAGLGASGYMLATVCADAFSALSLFLLLRLHRFFRPRGLDTGTAKDMLRYAVPLVPTAVFWWITNLSDRLFITYMRGPAENGVYGAAATLPGMITMVSSIFIQAWQLSAFTEYGGEKAARFYSNVFRSYYTFIFLAASGIILLIRPLTNLIVGRAEYQEAWRYSLFLVLAVSFSCFVTFLGTIYNAVKKNGMVTVTTAVGAVLNLVLNWLLIPQLGAIGAAVATFASYLVVFLIRAVDTRKYIKISMQPLRIAASMALLLGQIGVSLAQPKYGMVYQVLIFLALALCNLGYILFMARQVWELAGSMLRRKRA